MAVKPSITYFTGSRKVRYKQWIDDNCKFSRKFGRPAFIEYYYSGDVRFEQYYENGISVKKIYYLKNGNVSMIEHWKGDVGCHKTDGPAIIEYNTEGKKSLEHYWFEGVRYNTIAKEIIKDLELGDPDSWDDLQKQKFQFHFLCKVG